MSPSSSRTNIPLRVLRAKIRGLQLAGVAYTERINGCKGPKRHTLRLEKKRLGVTTRYHLIAFGLLRGVPYERIERCAPDNRPDLSIILKVMLQHVDWPHAKHPLFGRVIDLKLIEGLLNSSNTSAAAPASAVTSSGSSALADPKAGSHLEGPAGAS